MIGNQTTKIILEEQSETRTFEFSYNLSTTELVQEMYLLCLAGGHDKDNVASAMFELGSQLTEDYDNGVKEVECTTQGRMYHSGWDKYGDIIHISDDWVTARLDGDKGSGCWEVDAPYIKILDTGDCNNG